MTPRHARPVPPRPSRRGSVIVFVLLLIFLTAMLLARFIESTSVELLLEMRQADRQRLRDDARSALEVTLAVLADFQEIDRALYGPAQGWGDPLAYAGYVPREGVTIEVAFADESGKVSLPRTNRESLVAFAENHGLLQHDAERLADALLAWMREEYAGASSEVDEMVYELAPLPHRPAYRPIRTFDELRAIEVTKDYLFDETGRPTSLYEAFVQGFSLYEFESSNLNSGNAATMLVAGLDDSQSGRVSDYLAGKGDRLAGAPPYFRSMGDYRRIMGNAPAQNLGTEIRGLRVIVTAREGASMLRLSSLVAKSGQMVLPKPAEPVDSEVQEKELEKTSASAAPDNQARAATAASQAGRSRRTGSTNSASLKYPFVILEYSEEIPELTTVNDATT